jgi:hypothetical protein
MSKVVGLARWDNGTPTRCTGGTALRTARACERWSEDDRRAGPQGNRAGFAARLRFGPARLPRHAACSVWSDERNHFHDSENWQGSVAPRAGLSIGVAPLATYRFNAAALWSAPFRAAAKDRLGAFVVHHSLPAGFATSIGDRTIHGLELSPEQRARSTRCEWRCARRAPSCAVPDPIRPRRAHGMPPFICLTSIACLSALLIIVQQNISDLEATSRARSNSEEIPCWFVIVT